MACKRLIVVALVLLGIALSGAALPGFAAARRADPPCQPGIRWLFRPPELCAEELISDFHGVPGMVSISALAFGPDGALYFAHPSGRQIMRLGPDGAGFFGTPEVFADALPEPPIGLSYDAQTDAFYVSCDTLILRIPADRPDEIVILVRDLPGGQGSWLGNVRIGPDRRLYVAKGSAGVLSDQQDPRRGTLLSFALDGGDMLDDMQIVASGLRSAFDFDWHPADGTLYIVDDTGDDAPAELNALPPGTRGAHFGWPDCPTRNCLESVLRFDPQSSPAGAIFYQGAAFPELRGSLLVNLAGSWNATTIAGYELVRVRFEGNRPTGIERWLPAVGRSTSDASVIRASFYPYHLTGLTVSAEGWIYAGIAEGRIYRFRPRP